MLTVFSFVAIWFVGNKYLQRAFQTTVDNKDCFHQLGHFKDMETYFSSIKFFKHIQASVLDLLNTLQYVPQFIVIHTGVSDFLKYNNLQQHNNIKTMAQHVNRLIKAVDTHHSDGF